LPLIPAGKYRLHSVFTGKEIGVFDRSAWARGVSIPFFNKDTVEVLEVTAVKS
jgi:hypothetical protein